MHKQRKASTGSNRGKFILIGVAIAVIGIGVGAAISMQGPASLSSPLTTGNSRSIFWLHVHGLGIDPSDRSILYIATHGDFYQSINGEPPVKVDRNRADYMGFNAPRAVGHPLYASGHPLTGGSTGLIKSEDGGQTWERVSNVLEPPVDFHAMAVGKSDPNVILGFDSGGRGLFKTSDAGKTWKKLDYPSYVISLAISPESQIVFAGTKDGIFQTDDDGKSWIQLEQYKGVAVLALAFDEDGVLYVSNKLGLSRSPDFGKTWEKIDAPSMMISSIAVDSHSKVIYVAGSSSGGFEEVFRSSDGGKSWQLIGTDKGP